MSKIFYDNILELKKLDKEIKKVAKSKEEREELWKIVDEIVHHKALGCIFDKLPKQKHVEFLDLFHANPHNEDIIFGYLQNTIDVNFKEIMKAELGGLAYEILQETKKTPRN